MRLIRLKTALENNDTNGINRAIGLLDGATSQLDLTRADLVLASRRSPPSARRWPPRQNNLQASLSNTVDVDMASAITNLTSLQTSFTATLQMTAQLSRLTLLNYL